MDDSRVALALVEHGDMKPSKANVELAKESVSSRCFVPLNSVVELREQSRAIDIPGKIDYLLSDGSWVAVDVDTIKTINSLIKENEAFDLALKMASSQTSFLATLRALTKDNHGN